MDGQQHPSTMLPNVASGGASVHMAMIVREGNDECR